MKKLLSILLCLLVYLGNAQEKPVELIEQSQGNIVILYAKSHAEIDYNIEVKINLINAKTNVGVPISKLIKAGGIEEVAVISPEDASKDWTYSIGYSYEKYNEQVNIITDDNSIIVFTMDGCGRCNYTIEYLKNQNIKFIEYNTTNNDANNMAMWNKLKEANFGSSSIRMPVIVTNGKTHFNISSLPSFLKTVH